MASRNLSDLHPRVAKAAEAALSACKLAGLDVLVTCTFRDGAEQNALYAQGRSAPGKIVTNAHAGESMHQYRMALDLVPLVHGKPDWDGSHPVWHQVAGIFKAYGFEWGYDWAHFKEMPHFQMAFGHPLSWFQAGNKVPTE